jgi:cytochrome c oxidase subunit 4
MSSEMESRLLEERAARSDDEDRRMHVQPNYMAIFWWLFGLTVGEVCFSVFTHPPRAILMSVLVGLAIVKATLVALFFMHLKFERKTLGIIVASTLILGAILVSVGIAEHILPRP